MDSWLTIKPFKELIFNHIKHCYLLKTDCFFFKEQLHWNMNGPRSLILGKKIRFFHFLKNKVVCFVGLVWVLFLKSIFIKVYQDLAMHFCCPSLLRKAQQVCSSVLAAPQAREAPNNIFTVFMALSLKQQSCCCNLHTSPICTHHGNAGQGVPHSDISKF